MQFYIDSFVSGLPAAQQTALRSLVTKKSNSQSGLSNVSVISELTRLTSSLTSRGKIYSLIDSIKSRRSGDTSMSFNDLLDALSEDLGIVFSELDSIGSTFEAMDRLTARTQDSIERSLAELDNVLTAIESIDEQPEYRFRIASLNTFNTPGAGAIKLTHPLASFVYKDPRTNRVYDARDQLTINWSAEGATLPIKLSNPRTIRNVYISESLSTTESDLNIEPIRTELNATPTNSIENITKVDNKIWAKFTYLSKERQGIPPKAKAELVLDLGGLVSINSVEISPAASAPLVIESISYMSGDGNLYTILDTEITVNATAAISFARVLASKVYLQLRQDNYLSIEKQISSTTGSTYIALPTELAGLSSTVGALSVKTISGTPLTATYRLDGWLYTFAIDRIAIGLANFAEVGIHASEPIELDFVPDMLGLTSNFTNSTDFSGNEADALEHYLYIFEYADSLLHTTAIPIIPIAQRQVVHENVLPNSSGIATLRFYPDRTESLTIYKNFVPLINVTSGDLVTYYTVSNDALLTERDTFPPVTTPAGMKRTLTLSIKNPEPSAIYTASYTPETGVADIMYLDREQRAAIRANNIVSYTKASELATKSKLVLVSILRSTNFDANFRESGILFDYTVFAR